MEENIFKLKNQLDFLGKTFKYEHIKRFFANKG